jgi:hypothetical protein
MRAGWALLLLALAGCLKDTRPSQERGAARVFSRAPEIQGPATDRCQAAAETGTGKPGCRDAKYLAQVYVRKLGTTDEVCLEGGFGQAAPTSCLARAFVADAAVGRLLLEIRSAQPQSRWYNQVQHQLWFTENALIDLYLAERGY